VNKQKQQMMEDKKLILIDLNTGKSVMNKEKKKRQRLTHLTAEEKQARRKLKNRIAAQTARDRKKLKCDDMEKKLDELRKDNETLRTQNRSLKEKTQLLIKENRRLLQFKMMNEKNNSLFKG
jgi:X box-binding protein 1